MKKFFLNSLIFVAISYALLFGLDLYYTKHIVSHKNVCEKADWIFNKTNQHYDFVIIGNSRAINMVDIKTIESKTNTKGINLGIIGANNAEIYLALQKFLANGNTVDNVIMQYDMHNINAKDLPYPFHVYNYVPYIHEDSTYEIIRNNNPIYKALLWKYIPFSRYMEFSNKYVLYKILKGGFECTTNPTTDTTSGTEFITDLNYKNKAIEYSYVTLNSQDQNYYQKILNYLETKKINTLCYTAPMLQEYYFKELNLPDLLQKNGAYLTSRNIKYFNFNTYKSTALHQKSNFNDMMHMNINGTKAFSNVLADSIKPYLK